VKLPNLFAALSVGASVGFTASAIAILAVVVALTRYFVQSSAQTKIDRLEDELGRERERSEGLVVALTSVRSGQSGAMIKTDVDTELQFAMSALDATAASVLVPAPIPHDGNFVFLSIFGPSASKIRKTKLPLDKGKVGAVFKSGILDNTRDPYRDAEFFSAVDEKGEEVTRSLLTFPLKHEGATVGVAQFLNKRGNKDFAPEDETVATNLCARLAPKVAAFANNPENFDILGLSQESTTTTGTIAFCDLTASSSLFEKMNAASAIYAINEYLEQQSSVALKHGATIDKYVGDGIMLAFNVPQAMGDDHMLAAVTAACEMQHSFERLKTSWLRLDTPAAKIYNRVGIASGTVYQAIVGHPSRQQITVIGDTVNRASNLCEFPIRDRNVILIDQTVHRGLEGRFTSRAVPTDVLRHAKGAPGPAYEVSWE
jgi:class 3 adenylate cyclase